MECAADGHKGRRRRGGLKTRERRDRMRERERKMRACWRVCWSARSKVPSDPKGRRNVFIPSPTPPSDQEGLSRHEWFIPSISGDYFIYPEDPLLLLSLSLQSAHIADFSYHRRRSRDSRPMKSSTDTSKSPRSIRGFVMGEKNFATSWRSQLHFVLGKWDPFINPHRCPSRVSGHVA